MNKYKKFIKVRLDRRTLLEQLAEEASELSKAALKCIRAEKMSDNPTPVTLDEADRKLCEEINDVLVVAEVLNLVPDGTTENNPKWRRWTERMADK